MIGRRRSYLSNVHMYGKESIVYLFNENFSSQWSLEQLVKFFDGSRVFIWLILSLYRNGMSFSFQNTSISSKKTNVSLDSSVITKFLRIYVEEKRFLYLFQGIYQTGMLMQKFYMLIFQMKSICLLLLMVAHWILVY